MNVKYIEMIKRADSGDVVAQLELAMAYFEGEVNGESELSQGLSYMKKAAESGNDKIENMYAEMLHTMGLIHEAFIWYERAAKHGNVDSQVKLAQDYFAGTVREKNTQEALYWAKKAFDAGELQESPLILGTLYIQKDNVKEEEVICAYKLFKLAEANGNETARDFRIKMEELVPELKK